MRCNHNLTQEVSQLKFKQVQFLCYCKKAAPRQDMQRLSDIIANSPVLASQASVSVQQPLDEGAGVSSTPKSTSMQASFQDDGNPSQAEHTPLVPLRDESLHAIRGCDQDHKHSPYSSQHEIAAGRPLISDEFTTFMCQTAGLILSVLIELQPFYFRFSCVISE